MKEKYVTFCFIKLNTNKFLKDHWARGAFTVQGVQKGCIGNEWVNYEHNL